MYFLTCCSILCLIAGIASIFGSNRKDLRPTPKSGNIILSPGEVKSKFLKLNEHLEKLKVFFNAKAKCKAFKSELYEIVFSDDMRNKSLIEMANDVARREAINKTLIIVHKNLGFQIIKNIDRIYCTRITQSKCRISVLGIK